jgi:hypothetical protein
MAELNFNTLYTNGDSWTAGDIVDPEIFGDQLQHSMHPDNEEYRLPRVWPHKLGKHLGVEVVNKSHAGASNDRIVRSTINDIYELLKTTRAEDLYVIIGWSSPERKDFFLGNADASGGTWDCIYPAEMLHWKDENNSMRNEFYKAYVTLYWNPEEYITRHCLNNITLHSFLESKGIKHTFFNAFYEAKGGVIDPERHQLYDQPKLTDYIDSFRGTRSDKQLHDLQMDNTLIEYSKLYNDLYFKTSFIEQLLSVGNRKEVEKYLDFHPTELGHDSFAKLLFDGIFN